MHPKIATLGTSQGCRDKIAEVYEWFVERIKEYGGSYRTPVLSEISGFVGVSDNTLGKYLRQLVGLGLLVVSNPDNKKWRYARYSLPVEGQEADSIIEQPINWRFAEEKAEEEPQVEEEEPRSEQQDEQVEAVSEVGLVPYIEGHSQLIRTERVMLDFDVGNIYGVSTREINQSRNNNPVKFTDPTTGRQFAFQLNDDETEDLQSKSLIAISPMTRVNPWVYTQEGCNMLATILKSDKAVLRAIQIVKVFTDLERMAHGEEPKQPGFAEAISSLVEYNKSLTTNIFRLTSGVEAIKVDLDERKADKTDVDEVKQTIEEVKAEVSGVKQTVAEITDADKNRIMQADIDQYIHISAQLDYHRDIQKNPSTTYGMAIAARRREIKGKYHLGDAEGATTHIPVTLLPIIHSDAKQKIFKRLKTEPYIFYKLEDYHQKFLIQQGYEL